MRLLAKGLISSLFFMVFFSPSPPALVAGDHGAIRLKQIQPGLENGYLTVSAEIENLFSPKIVGTIQSGLPSIVEIEIKLLEAGKKSRVHKLLRRSIAYNIWDEYYTVRDQDTTQIVKDFEIAKQLTCKIEHQRLLAEALLNVRAKYVIKIRVQVIPISVRQGEKVVDWLQDANQTEEDLASEDRAGGFKLNLTKLVSFFIGGNKGRGNRSEWFASPSFSIAELRK